MRNWENFPTKPIRREALAAEYAHFSNYRTYRDAKYVIQRGSPELVHAMDRECISISTAAQLLLYSPQTATDFNPTIIKKSSLMPGDSVKKLIHYPPR